ncbi:MAG: ketopantoate reductase [Bradymonadaceae bacterium]|nr:ketopantoate reductase [Lujinxingiaceae bacterium]
MKVLIMGAGSVGQVFGYHLQLAGAEVSFYVRPKYVAECEAGFVLYDHGRLGLAAPLRFKAEAVLSTLEELERTSFDQVYLCIPSNGLRGGWFGDFAARLGDAVLVSLCNGMDDRDFIAEHFDVARTVTGLITQISYPAPLPGEDVLEPGTAYWFPPLAPHPFEGPKEHVEAAVKWLKKGGLPSKVAHGLSEKSTYPSVVLMTFIMGLEAADWSFAQVRSAANMKRIHGARREGLAMVSGHQKTTTPLALRLLNPMIMRMVLFLATQLIPFDLETYLRVHFTKVGAQTRMYVKNWIATSQELGLPSKHLEELGQALGPQLVASELIDSKAKADSILSASSGKA